MVKKFFPILIMLILMASLVLFLGACDNNTLIEEEFTIEILEEYRFIYHTIGDTLIWNNYYFNILDENGDLIESKFFESSMFEESELEKLAIEGQKSLVFSYRGKRAYINLIVQKMEVVPKYLVQYDANDGYFESQGIDTFNILERNENQSPVLIGKFQSSIQEIPIPIRQGYVFSGWHLDIALSQKIITPLEVSSEMILHAKWTLDSKFRILFKETIDDKENVLEERKQVTNQSLIILTKPKSYLKYDFIKYEIYEMENDSENQLRLVDEIEAKDVEYTITTNLLVKLIYETKMIKITYKWSIEEEEVSEIYFVEYDSSYDLHLHPLPEKLGHDGKWLNEETQQPPNYNNIVEDFVITAYYSKKSFTVKFYSDKDEEISSFETLVEYGSTLNNPPLPIPKTGHIGFWQIITSGHYSKVDFSELVIDDNLIIYLRYTPAKYKITLNFELKERSSGEKAELVKIIEHSYSNKLSYEDFINLYDDIVLDDVYYLGYNEKYYEVTWYTSKTYEASKKVVFPYTVTEYDVNLYAKESEKPYIIQFLVDPQYGDFEIVTLSRNKGARITPPTFSIQGYDITGWYHYLAYSNYNENNAYSKGDYVFYLDNYYLCKLSHTGVFLPDEESSQYWDYAGNSHPKKNFYSSETSYIIADDFHEYSEDPIMNQAFYPLLSQKKYTLSFYTWEITGTSGNYTIEKNVKAREDVHEITHGANLELSNYFQDLPGGNFPAFPPVYPDGAQESDFVLQYWYTDSSYNSAPINPEQEISILSDMTFYAYWVDLLAGTEGLEFAIYEGNGENPESYEVIGLSSNLPSYSYIDVIVPEKHQGLPVVSINKSIFKNNLKNLKIQSISMTKNIKNIDEGAFIDCPHLTEIILEEENTHFKLIGGVLFDIDTTKLIVMPSRLNDLEENFSYNIPESVIEIYEGAFSGCVSLISISVENVSNTGENPFEGGNLKSIGELAFTGCTNLATFLVPNSLETIGERAFLACYNLENLWIGENSNLKNVGNEILKDTKWYSNSSMSEFVTLGNVLLSYNHLNQNKIITLANHYIAIADSAFDSNDFQGNNIECIIISADSSITYIGKFAFKNCNSLSELKILTPSKIDFSEDSLLSMPSFCKLYVPSSLIAEYDNDPFVNIVFSLEKKNLFEN